MRVRPVERKPQTSRRRARLVNTRRGSLASFSNSSYSFVGKRTRCPATVTRLVGRSISTSPANIRRDPVRYPPQHRPDPRDELVVVERAVEVVVAARSKARTRSTGSDSCAPSRITGTSRSRSRSRRQSFEALGVADQDGIGHIRSISSSASPSRTATTSNRCPGRDGAIEEAPRGLLGSCGASTALDMQSTLAKRRPQVARCLPAVLATRIDSPRKEPWLGGWSKYAAELPGSQAPGRGRTRRGEGSAALARARVTWRRVIVARSWMHRPGRARSGPSGRPPTGARA